MRKGEGRNGKGKEKKGGKGRGRDGRTDEVSEGFRETGSWRVKW